MNTFSKTKLSHVGVLSVLESLLEMLLWAAPSPQGLRQEAGPCWGPALGVGFPVSQPSSFLVPAALIDRWVGLLSRTTAFHLDFPRDLVHSFDKPGCPPAGPLPTLGC